MDQHISQAQLQDQHNHQGTESDGNVTTMVVNNYQLAAPHFTKPNIIMNLHLNLGPFCCLWQRVTRIIATTIMDLDMAITITMDTTMIMVITTIMIIMAATVDDGKD